MPTTFAAGASTVQYTVAREVRWPFTLCAEYRASVPPAPASDLASLSIERGPGRRRRRSPWIGRAIWLALILGALWLFQRPVRGWIERLRLPAVTVERAVLRDARSAGALAGTAANGFVVARVRAALSADTPGRIVELNVVEGTRVAKGDVVARLYADEYEAALRQAEADAEWAAAGLLRSRAELASVAAALEGRRAEVEAARSSVAEAEAASEYARAEHARVAEMAAGGIESERARSLAVRDLSAAEARGSGASAGLAAAASALVETEQRLAAAEIGVTEATQLVALKTAARDLAAATLEKTIVRAPFDGVVVSKEAEVGEIVSPSSQGGSNARGSVATIVDLATLEVQADVPETSLAGVTIGAPARVFLDAYPSKAYAGRVDRVWPMADRQRATVEVRGVLLEPDELLRPEMGVRVVFLAEEPGEAPADVESLVRIPATALVRREGAQFVFVHEGDRVRLRSVDVADTSGARIHVRRGLEDGESVVTNPPADLADGERVRVVE